MGRHHFILQLVMGNFALPRNCARIMPRLILLTKYVVLHFKLKLPKSIILGSVFCCVMLFFVICFSQQGDSPLYWAAQHGHLEMVKYLCNVGAVVNIRDVVMS